jgi:ribosomal protein S18 acetylase RimI-like enzyme
MDTLQIKPYAARYKEAVLEITSRAWRPVFARMQHEVPSFVYKAFYPNEWEARQRKDVAALLDDEATRFWVALRGNSVLGYVGLRRHPDDRMGEICIIAVDPEYQRQGVGRRLIEFAERRIREEGMTMVLVETVGDSGHEPARRAYETSGYERWPVVRYFKRLR